MSVPGDFELTFALVPSDPSLIEFSMSAETSGWVAFGWSDGTPAHQQTDMYTGVANGGACTVTDQWSTSKSRPAVDGQSDIVAGSAVCSTAGGRTTITFRRKLSTGDTLTDLPVENKPVLLQWAYATSTNLGTVHTATGTGFVNFLAAPGT